MQTAGCNKCRFEIKRTQIRNATKYHGKINMTTYLRTHDVTKYYCVPMHNTESKEEAHYQSDTQRLRCGHISSNQDRECGRPTGKTTRCYSTRRRYFNREIKRRRACMMMLCIYYVNCVAFVFIFIHYVNMYCKYLPLISCNKISCTILFYPKILNLHAVN